MILGFLSMLWADQLRVVRAGDTVESLAGPAADQVRRDNGLAPGQQPGVGTVLRLPGGTDSAGLVLSLTGTGTLGVGGTPLVLGQQLPPGSLVCTTADSFLTIRLAVSESGGTHDEVTLLGGTCVSLTGSSGFGRERSTLLDLQQGYVSVRPTIQDPGRVAVRTADGVTAGEEGGFRVAVEQGSTRTEALYRPVAVIGGGVEQPLQAGEGSRVRRGQVPTKPVKLPPPGSPEAPADEAPFRRPDFYWSPVDRALGYRLELASDADFQSLLMVRDVPGSPWLPDYLMLPYQLERLYWRVSSYDRNGYYGVPSGAHRLNFPEGMRP
jgi:hypothetical protein